MPYLPIGFDESGLIAFEKDNSRMYNPFEIALQAMIGKKVMLAYNRPTGNLVPRYYPIRYLPDPSKDIYAINAMRWLLDNETLEGNCGYWNYSYDTVYAGESIKAPWRSSFAQSYVALAALLWYKHTKLQQYKEIALRALNGLAAPISDGGTAFIMGDGLWYEEIPSTSPTHIFNAQLVSLIVLAEARELLQEEHLNLLIDKGVAAFLAKCDFMDTGNWSAYDIPHEIDLFLQLVPKDAGRTIKIREISILDEGKKRVINVGLDESFEPGLQWIAGIDWGKVDAEGYREIIYGPAVHPVPVLTGDRQNSFLYFKDISTKVNTVCLRIDYRAEYETELLLFRTDSNGKFIPLGYSDRVSILKGDHQKNIYIPVPAITPPLSEDYHWFHTLLLEELNQLLPSVKLKSLVNRFRKDLIDRKGVFLETHVELKSVYVRADRNNTLSSNVSDYPRKIVSPFRNNVHLKKSQMEFDYDYLFSRIKEASDSLKLVHFIGTELTKNTDLVSNLKNIGLKIAVTTNGIDLNESLSELLETGIDELWVSFEGSSRIHDQIRGEEGQFHNILKTLTINKKEIKKRNKSGFTLYATSVITPLNYEFLSDLIIETKTVPIDCYCFTHINFIAEGVTGRHNKALPEYPINPYPSMCQKILPKLINPYILWTSISNAETKAKELSKNFVVVPKMDYFLQLEDYYKRPCTYIATERCYSAANSMEINYDGSIFVRAGCCQISIGSIYDNTLFDLFHSLPLIKFRKEILSNGSWEPCFR